MPDLIARCQNLQEIDSETPEIDSKSHNEASQVDSEVPLRLMACALNSDVYGVYHSLHLHNTL